MSLAEALEVLGVAPGTPMAEVRVRYRRLVRTTHPDLGHGPSATVRTSRITAAFAAVRAAAAATGSEVVPSPAVDAPPARSWPPSSAPAPPTEASPDVAAAAAAAATDSDTITIEAPAPEAFALLLDAAAHIGAVGYVDRHLGLLEILVRFEGGPTCSVLTTLQGRAHGTEVCCTMESIEAAPAPPIRPVVEALVEALRRSG